MPNIVLPICYNQVTPANALKGEAYAEQAIKSGYDAGSRDALAVLASIAFELQGRIDRLMAIR